MVGQVRYKYKGGTEAPEIFSDMLTNGVISAGGSTITALAVQAPWGTKMMINERPIMVGYTGIYLLPDGVKVTSLSFVNGNDLKDILIDYILE